MDTTPAHPDVTRTTFKHSMLPVTLSSLEGEKDKSSSIFPVFVGILAIFPVIVAFCILWNRNKRKKCQVPYLQATPSLTLPRPRQRTKNIYDLLPRQQEELGRHRLSSRVFSTESLLSRNFDSPEHAVFQADDAPQMHRACIHAAEYAIGIYDNATVPQMCELLTPSAHYINVRASRDSSSISSKESHDYVNVPTERETAETLISSNSTSKNHFVLPSALELKFTEEKNASSKYASDRINFGDPVINDSDGEGSSQTSNDYVNMTGLDLGDIQEKQPCVAFPCCRDYENIPPADPKGNQQQVEEDMTTSNTDHGEGRTDAPATHIQPGSRALPSAHYVAFQPSTQSEDRQMIYREEVLNEDANNYESVLAAELGGGSREQQPSTQLAPDEQTSIGSLHEVIYLVQSLATGETSEDA